MTIDQMTEIVKNNTDLALDVIMRDPDIREKFMLEEYPIVIDYLKQNYETGQTNSHIQIPVVRGVLPLQINTSTFYASLRITSKEKGDGTYMAVARKRYHVRASKSDIELTIKEMKSEYVNQIQNDLRKELED